MDQKYLLLYWKLVIGSQMNSGEVTIIMVMVITEMMTRIITQENEHFQKSQ